jgi:hypothetical protein
MNNQVKIVRNGFLLTVMLLVLGGILPAFSQTSPSGSLKWLRVGSLQTYFSEQGSETEAGDISNRSIEFAWPAEYGLVQTTARANGMWLGCKNFYDTQINQTLPYKVVGIGPRNSSGSNDEVITPPVEFRLVGRFEHPSISVDNAPGSLIGTQFDLLDEVDPYLASDRMLLVQNNTSIGVTVTKKVLAFARQGHDNYFIYDYTLKNTGIVDRQGIIYHQTLMDFFFYLLYRYALSGESVSGYNQGWGNWNSTWGRNMIYDVVGPDPNASDFLFRAIFAWYGPHSQRPVPDDWGCPDQLETGVLAAAKYIGVVTLHADASSMDASDDPFQPRTTHYEDSDGTAMWSTGQYDIPAMANRYAIMTRGHAVKTHAQEVGDGFADLWGPGIGGTQEGLGFGPYTLYPGDSIHIVLAQGVGGLNREKNREVGANWLNAWNGSGSTTLVLPDGSTTTDYNLYKRSWVWTCKDSLFQTFLRARGNYNYGYHIPRPPPPPEMFTVTSGSDRIQLHWSDNAESWPNFDGYVIYRSEGNVLEPKTVYRKIFECDKSNAVTDYDDITASRGVDYYYYIQSKDDGTVNDVDPGKPLTSSMFWTVTDMPASLLNPGDVGSKTTHPFPQDYELAQNFPNPFNPQTTIRFGLPETACVDLKIFNIRGEEIRALLNGVTKPKGYHEAVWDGKDGMGMTVPGGIYIYRLVVKQRVLAGKMVFSK